MDPITRRTIVKKIFTTVTTRPAEILAILQADYNTTICSKTLRRDLIALNLTGYVLGDVVTAIQEQLQGTGSCLGYRSMQRRLHLSYKINVPSELVRRALRVIDPVGVERRRHRRLQRRIYYTPGPLYLCHADGYDKIKRFGFAIYGMIDGYSRYVQFLRVGKSNNDPKVIGGYFLDWVKKEKRLPKTIRLDAGTETGLLQAIQMGLRDPNGTMPAILIGKSVHNERIERYWGSLRIVLINEFMLMFAALEQSGFFVHKNILHMELLSLCFTELIQNNLNRAVDEHNTHRLRPNRGSVAPVGKPVLLYSSPPSQQTYNWSVAHHNLDDIEQLVVREQMSPFKMALLEMIRAYGFHYPPARMNDAVSLYLNVLPIASTVCRM